MMISNKRQYYFCYMNLATIYIAWSAIPLVICTYVNFKGGGQRVLVHWQLFLNPKSLNSHLYMSQFIEGRGLGFLSSLGWNFPYHSFPPPPHYEARPRFNKFTTWYTSSSRTTKIFDSYLEWNKLSVVQYKMFGFLKQKTSMLVHCDYYHMCGFKVFMVYSSAIVHIFKIMLVNGLQWVTVYNHECNAPLTSNKNKALILKCNGSWTTIQIIELTRMTCKSFIFTAIFTNENFCDNDLQFHKSFHSYTQNDNTFLTISVELSFAVFVICLSACSHKT